MAHVLRALVAHKQVLEKLATAFKLARLCPLKDPQFGLVPLTKQFLEELNDEGSNEFPESLSIPESLLKQLEICSKTAAIAYVQTEYFGSAGEQGIIVWQDGTIVYEAIVSGTGAINTGLQKLGIKKSDNMDEFDTLGLGQHRFTDDWIARQS